MRRLDYHLAMIGAVALVILTLVLTFPARSALGETIIPKVPVESVVVENNHGGVIVEFEQLRDELREIGAKVYIKGYCASACTLFTTLPNICVHPDTKLGFHAPYFNVDGILRVYNANLTTEFFAKYPPKIQKWLKAHGGLGHDVIWLKGRALTRMFPLCEEAKKH
ncbi:hypothetical protein [Mesorhizobium sp.]|uniref:hypothetical protein n=1 Tax=Mesorhizobium sp. TaxID=1871066 RepID=UPI000FE7D306|nr:hypothetical protein [Mesorhizobium sp.]RWM84321.1 MAG: hypothetical protein EOR83_17015 [Mesorhizobium sp.]